MSTSAELTEQVAYYRAVAGEYEDHSIAAAGQNEIEVAFDAFGPTGDVLELACGPGVWTERLLRSAASVTAVDAAPEMLRRARERAGTAQVRFIEADLFSWAPERRYDAVFFGFWLSHIPEDRFERFWSMVADCLAPEGQVFFVDDNHRTEAELVEGPGSVVVERRLNDGSAYRAIKVPHRPAKLEHRLRSLGWDVTVTATAGPFYWGTGSLQQTGAD